MLRIMRRRNALKDDQNLFEFIREKGFALGTDFIVGHPGESEKRWLDGLENFKRFPITHLHGFSYSDRSGTHASTLKDRVGGDVAKSRLKTLEEIVKASNFSFRKEQQKELLVLVEEQKGDTQAGYDQFFNKIHIKSDKNLQKEWVSISKYEVKQDGNHASFV
jgi:tRNA A37 methylthiotransferase MiaB